MNNVLLLLSCLLFSIAPPKSIYSIVFKGINGSQIDMSMYRNKKILVSTFQASQPDLAKLRLQNYLYRANKDNLIVIAIPVNNGDSFVDEVKLQSLLTDSLHIEYIIARPGKSSKGSGESQHKLLKWITNVSENGHFDNDITKQGQMFLINERGALYGLFDPKTTYTILNDAINEPNDLE